MEEYICGTWYSSSSGHRVPTDRKSLHEGRCPGSQRSSLQKCEYWYLLHSDSSVSAFEWSEHRKQCRGDICDFCCAFLKPSEVATHTQECPVLTQILNEKVVCEICNLELNSEDLKDHLYAHQFESATPNSTQTRFSRESSTEDPGDCEDAYPEFLTFQCTRSNREECNICMSGICQGHMLKMLPCMHKFHKVCLCMWLKRQKQCPICQTDV